MLASSWEDEGVAEGRPRRRLYSLTGKGARVAEEVQGRVTLSTPRVAPA
jgi:PadR family transcriptional regulator, regulatory protein PadR